MLYRAQASVEISLAIAQKREQRELHRDGEEEKKQETKKIGILCFSRFFCVAQDVREEGAHGYEKSVGGTNKPLQLAHLDPRSV